MHLSRQCRWQHWFAVSNAPVWMLTTETPAQMSGVPSSKLQAILWLLKKNWFYKYLIHSMWRLCERFHFFYTSHFSPVGLFPWLSTHASKVVYHTATWSSLNSSVSTQQMLMYCQKLSLSPLRCLFLQCITSLSPSLPLLAELANDFDFRYCVFSRGHCYPDWPIVYQIQKHNSSPFALGRFFKSLFFTLTNPLNKESCIFKQVCGYIK